MPWRLRRLFGAGHSPDLAVARSGVRSCLQARGEIMHSQCPDPASMCWHRALSDLPRSLEALRRSRALAGVRARCWWKRRSLCWTWPLPWSSALCRSVTVSEPGSCPVQWRTSSMTRHQGTRIRVVSCMDSGSLTVFLYLRRRQRLA